MSWLSLKQFLSEFKTRKNAQHSSASLRTTNYELRTDRGFSILEVLITAAIIGLITGLVTLRYGSFNNLILLKNQAYQIALELREMQARSLSVTGSGSNFRGSYGIFFSADSQYADRYVIFLDVDAAGGSGNGLRLSTGAEDLEVRRLDSRFRIQSASCDGVSTDVHVVFRRPNFDAVMNGGGRSNCSIVVESVNGGATRSVNVNAAGQITVE